MCLTEAARGTDLGLLRPARSRAGDGSYRHHRHQDLHHRRRARHDRPDRAPRAGPAAGRARRHRGHLALHRAEAAGGPRAATGRAKRRRVRLDRAQDGHPRRRPPACCTSTARVGELVGEPHAGMAQMFTMMNRGPARGRHAGRGHRRDRLPVGARLCPPSAGRAARAGAPAAATGPTRSSSTPTCAARCCDARR